MKNVKKKMANIVLTLCLLATNFSASIPKEKDFCANNFNGEYILPNFAITKSYNS